MLRPRLSRTISRLRSARSHQAYYHAPAQLPQHIPFPDGPLPENLATSSPSRTSSFPLYPHPNPYTNVQQPQQDLPFDPYKNPNLLPSDESIQRDLKLKLTSNVIKDLPEFEEHDLRNFYRNLVESGIEGEDVGLIAAPEEDLNIRKSFDIEERKKLLKGLEQRLIGMTLDRAVEDSSQSDNGLSELISTSSPLHFRLTFALAALVGDTSLSQAHSHGSLVVPLGIVSRSEWDALFQEFISQKDTVGVERLFNVMEGHGVPVIEEYMIGVMEVDALAGRTNKVINGLRQLDIAGIQILPLHHDLVIRSYIHSSPSRVDEAISHLKSFEAAGTPLPQTSYNLLLSHLLLPSPSTLPTAQTRALGLDLFAHMRFVAHPTPSKEIYTTMIKSCADPRDPQPERARDWWIEMTISENISPGREEYEAIMRALGSTKKDYLEAFDLLREMLAKHYEANFIPFDEEQGYPTTMRRSTKYVPTIETFTVLLEGTKRAGDVNRARWVLTEVVRLVRARSYDNVDWKQGINEELMAGVFMTYAAWKPVVKRGSVKAKLDMEERVEVQEGKEGMEESVFEVDMLQELEDGGSVGHESRELGQPQRSSIPSSPQTSADAIREATALFQRVIEDTRTPHSPNSPLDHPFHSVKVTSRLVNSYLSVHVNHSPNIEAAREAWKQTWSSINARPNAWSYLMILEKCSTGNRVKSGAGASDRPLAFEWGKEIWKEYIQYSNRMNKILEKERKGGADEENIKRRWDLGLSDRQIEKAWISVIRLHALSDDLSEALALLEEFNREYPPSLITDGYKPTPPSPVSVRLSSPILGFESGVSPHIVWKDVDVVHQRLVRDEDLKGVGRLKWICMGYEGALGKRRRWRYGGVGIGRERMRREKGLIRSKDVDEGDGDIGA